MWGWVKGLVEGGIAGIGKLIYNTNRMIRNLGRAEQQARDIEEELDDRDTYEEESDRALADARDILRRHRERRNREKDR